MKKENDDFPAKSDPLDNASLIVSISFKTTTRSAPEILEARYRWRSGATIRRRTYFTI